jgi:leader peptidase (prepilin peptidase)/N-methyltransferase
MTGRLNRLSTPARVGIAASTVVGGAVAVSIRPAAAAAVYGIAFAALLTAAAIDAATQRLPNILTIGTAAWGLLSLTAISLATGSGSPLRLVMGGLIFGGWILLGALLSRDGYGLGDVKLAAACGILAGWLSWATLAATILATQVAITLALLVARAHGRRRAALGLSFVSGLLVAAIVTRL